MHRLIALLLTGIALLGAVPARVAAQTLPGGCNSIANVPATYAIDYQQDIQPIFSFGCANCHVDSAGAPEADLDLDPKPSWFNLVGVSSSQDPAQVRVIAGDALRSLLFRKVNCDIPGPFLESERMPQNRPDLQLADQALIYDWIMAGALNGPTDTLFFNSFELRGFVP